MSDPKKQEIVDVQDLHFYFDAQERDYLDRGGQSRRASEVISIRDRLLALPQRDFDSVVQTIKNMLSPAQGEVQAADAKTRRRDASELYDRVKSDKPTTSLKTSPI